MSGLYECVGSPFSLTFKKDNSILDSKLLQLYAPRPLMKLGCTTQQNRIKTDFWPNFRRSKHSSAVCNVVKCKFGESSV